MPEPNIPDRLIPLYRWNEFHLWPSVRTLRSYVFHEHINGFSRCILRMGNRIMIREKEIFQWFEEQNLKQGSRK